MKLALPLVYPFVPLFVLWLGDFFCGVSLSLNMRLRGVGDLALLLEVVASLDRDEVDGSSCTAGQTTLRPNIFTPLMEPHRKRSK